MRYIFRKLWIALLTMLLASCGLHLRGVTQIPAEMRKIVIASSDPYGALAQTVRQQLRMNNVQVVEQSAITQPPLPILRLDGEEMRRDTASIFINGKTAEYQMMLSIRASVLLPGSNPHPLTTSVYRSFFDNSQAALAKNSEQEIIRQEMRERAANQLIRKLLTVATPQRTQTTSTPVLPFVEE